MSMNINLRADKIGIFISNKTGQSEPFTQCFKFDCVQSPTVITKKILNSDNKLQTYKEWIKTFPFYKEHIKELNYFIKIHKDCELIWYEL